MTYEERVETIKEWTCNGCGDIFDYILFGYEKIHLCEECSEALFKLLRKALKK